MVSRRTVVLGGVSALGLGVTGLGLSGCTRDRTPRLVDPSGPEVAAAEAARNPGTIREFTLAPSVSTVDLGGIAVSTWTYGGTIPGPAIRVSAVEQIRALVDNRLPADTSVHWHGVALRNDADGVRMISQDPIGPGSRFTYQFTAPHPGTYWFHPHTGSSSTGACTHR